MKTFKTIIDRFKVVCDNHKQLNSFTSGDIFEVDLSNEMNFAKAHLIEQSATIEKNRFVFTFDLLVMDLVSADGSNETDVLNDTFLILADIYREFKNGNWRSPTLVDRRDFDISEVISCEPFTDRFENLLAGWKGSITISVASHLNSRNSPF
tara:strand:- start:4556 stop:5011 length:456 start_codon:yes stop_codon:yes gene_type:complete